MGAAPRPGGGTPRGQSKPKIASDTVWGFDGSGSKAGPEPPGSAVSGAPPSVFTALCADGVACSGVLVGRRGRDRTKRTTSNVDAGAETDGAPEAWLEAHCRTPATARRRPEDVSTPPTAGGVWL